MNIFLVRHGDAEPHRGGISDAQRALTEEGKALLRRAAKGWTKIISPPQYLVSSPLTRAVQTASIIKEAFKLSGEIILDPGIIAAKTSHILELCSMLGGSSFFFVGHEPDFSRYTSELISDGSANITFKKGMLVKISFSGRPKLGAGELEMLIPQKAYQ